MLRYTLGWFTFDQRLTICLCVCAGSMSRAFVRWSAADEIISFACCRAPLYLMIRQPFVGGAFVVASIEMCVLLLLLHCICVGRKQQWQQKRIGTGEGRARVHHQTYFWGVSLMTLLVWEIAQVFVINYGLVSSCFQRICLFIRLSFLGFLHPIKRTRWLF